MDTSLHYLTMANQMLIQKKLLEKIKVSGLTLGQPKVLDYLKDHDGASQKEIAAGCFIEAGSLTSILNRMEEKGLIERHMLNGNRRTFHIFMTEDQIESEIQKVVKLIDEVYKKFGFTYHVELSTRPDNSIGTEEEWDVATNALENAIKAMNIPYEVNEGDGAFYGPKIDFHIEDSLGRSWQCGTIQLDFQLPQRFELDYIGSDGEKHRPIVIHRVIFGSIERFIGILIENFADKFPTWLAPVQVKNLLIYDKFENYAEKIKINLEEAGIRVEIDSRTEKIGYKIREARLERTPYILVVGEKEAENNEVSVRSRKNGEEGAIALDTLVNRIANEVYNKEI